MFYHVSSIEYNEEVLVPPNFSIQISSRPLKSYDDCGNDSEFYATLTRLDSAKNFMTRLHSESCMLWPLGQFSVVFFLFFSFQRTCCSYCNTIETQRVCFVHDCETSILRAPWKPDTVKSSGFSGADFRSPRYWPNDTLY